MILFLSSHIFKINNQYIYILQYLRISKYITSQLFEYYIKKFVISSSYLL